MGVVSEKGWHRSPLNILSNNQQGRFAQQFMTSKLVLHYGFM